MVQRYNLFFYYLSSPPPKKKRSRGSQTLLSRFAYIIGILGLLCTLGAARLMGLWPRSETNGSVTPVRR